MVRLIQDERRDGAPALLFGRWRRFVRRLTVERIHQAEASIRQALGSGSLDGRVVVDLRGGGGLWSLAARRMGARVITLDDRFFAAACAAELKRRYFTSDGAWEIRKASNVARTPLAGLPRIDAVLMWATFMGRDEAMALMAGLATALPVGARIVIGFDFAGPRFASQSASLPSPPGLVGQQRAFKALLEVEKPRLQAASEQKRLRPYVTSWLFDDDLGVLGANRWKEWLSRLGYPRLRGIDLETANELLIDLGFRLVGCTNSALNGDYKQVSYEKLPADQKATPFGTRGEFSLAIQAGRSVAGPFETQGDRIVGRLPADLGPVQGTLVALGGGRLLGDAELMPDGRVALPGACALLAAENRPIHVADVDRIVLQRPFGHVNGRMWRAEAPGLEAETDRIGEPERSDLFLFRDGYPMGAAHTAHDDVVKLGRGRYSHWDGSIYFSTPEDSVPNVDGAVYEAVRPAGPLIPPAAL